ncbi:uncharacterized protein LOC111261525 [Varroa jacobsoni]|uniref:uncharacterized protein LOC111261525 n=1 Tax=Varroa jacobsoni TaxID=62625 RepID=UPI000BF8A7AB|nr:uncharacterized protein LOC111261525 [Varroa jacobsoni]
MWYFKLFAQWKRVMLGCAIFCKHPIKAEQRFHSAFLRLLPPVRSNGTTGGQPECPPVTNSALLQVADIVYQKTLMAGADKEFSNRTGYVELDAYEMAVNVLTRFCLFSYTSAGPS